MNNIEYFKKQVKYWSKKLKIPIHHIKTDQRMWYMCLASRSEYTNTIYYQPKYFKYERKFHIMHIIFHELGHFTHDNFSMDYPYGTLINKSIAENIAETFALKCLKKYYPEYYKKYCIYIKNSGAKILSEGNYLKHLFYFYGFSQIPEYQKYL